MDGQYRGPLAEGCLRIVTEERGPPVALRILEQRVVAAVRDGKVGVAEWTVDRVGVGGHAIVMSLRLVVGVQCGTDEMIATVNLGQERAFVADLPRVDGLEPVSYTHLTLPTNREV